MATVVVSASWRGTSTVNPSRADRWTCRAEVVVAGRIPGLKWRKVGADRVVEGSVDHRHRWIAEYEEVTSLGSATPTARIHVRDYCELCFDERPPR